MSMNRNWKPNIIQIKEKSYLALHVLFTGSINFICECVPHFLVGTVFLIDGCLHLENDVILSRVKLNNTGTLVLCDDSYSEASCKKIKSLIMTPWVSWHRLTTRMRNL